LLDQDPGLVKSGEASLTPANFLFFGDLDRSGGEVEEFVARPLPSRNQIRAWLQETNILRQTLTVG